VKRTSAEQFDKQAEHYNAQWNKWSEASLNWLLEHAHPGPEDWLLDVATGTGFTALAFAPHVKQVIGVDVSEGMLEQARANAAQQNITNVTFEQAAAESLPFMKPGFDIVTCRVAPHHFNSIEKFCSEAYRVLNPGGRFLIADTTVPDNEPEVDEWQNKVELLRDPSHVRNYSPNEWRNFAESAHFTVEEVGEQKEDNAMGLRDWMKKSGCTGEAAAEVTRLFAEAPPRARTRFSIVRQPDGDITFQWMRVVLSARKAT
jgi:ubiquinone/menaquinone biosynthesis C-methylase UbiE